MRRVGGLAFVSLVVAANVAIRCGGSVAPSADAATDASIVDANLDESVDADTSVFHDLTDGRWWSSIDLTDLLGANTGLSTAAFDGRYIYWCLIKYEMGGTAPYAMIRYDTSAPFVDPSSWKMWAPSYFMPGDAPTMFDGRFVYIGTTGDTQNVRELRFDTAGAWGDMTSISLSTSLPGMLLPDAAIWELASGSTVFDGRYVYYADIAHFQDGSVASLRFDTQGGFQDRTMWRASPTRPLGVYTFSSSTLVAPYVVVTQTSKAGVTTFYDTRLPFDDVASWKTIDLQSVSGDQVFVGSGTDGRFAYWVPSGRSVDGSNALSADGLVARHDMSSPLTDVGSWETFEATQVHPFASGFDHASWDGRHLYFTTGGRLAGHPDESIVVRYDTTRPFHAATSWSAYDFAPHLPQHPQGLAWGGAVVFDGEYLYIATLHGAPMVIRFDARTPRSMPKGFSGTFY